MTKEVAKMKVYWERFIVGEWRGSLNELIFGRRRFATVRKAVLALKESAGARSYRLVREDGLVLLEVRGSRDSSDPRQWTVVPRGDKTVRVEVGI